MGFLKYFANGVINFYFAFDVPWTVKDRSITIKLIERLPACVSRKRINDAKSSLPLLKLIPNLTTLIDYVAAGTRLIIETSPDFDQRSTLPWLIPATMLTIRGRCRVLVYNNACARARVSLEAIHARVTAELLSPINRKEWTHALNINNGRRRFLVEDRNEEVDVWLIVRYKVMMFPRILLLSALKSNFSKYYFHPI